MSTPVALKENLAGTARRHESTTDIGPLDVMKAILRPLASLKLTVVLFALSIFLVFASTLAQKELDVWEVIHGWYRIDERNLVIDHFPYLNPAELLVYMPFQ